MAVINITSKIYIQTGKSRSREAGELIKHILADGTELKSIEGRTIPSTGKTETVYRLIAEFLISSRPGRAAQEPKASKA